MVGDRISKAARGRRARVYEYEYLAKSADGKVITGRGEGASKEEFVRRLREKGYRVEKIERHRRPEKAAAEGAANAVRQLIRVLLEQAVKDSASVVRVDQGPAEARAGAASVCAWYLIGDHWHQVLGVPTYVWQPLRQRFAELAGMPLPDEGEQIGSLPFETEGKRYTARVRISAAQVWVEMPVDEAGPTGGTAADALASALYRLHRAD